MSDNGRIAHLRSRIDEIDTVLIDLLGQRARLSAQVQQARIADHGRRLAHGRESEVRGHFRDRLGAAGEGVAVAVLRLCRGHESASTQGAAARDIPKGAR
ncbi:chorismate mutase [Streptomyces sp. NPDC006711]|uniref:chorismate mutase n=1 Tax=unclassified Streptomyces TaxID=2593676 RepID=UPI00368C1936